MPKPTDTIETTDFTHFKQQLSTHKHTIDTELQRLSEHLLADTNEQFGEVPKEVVAAYAAVLLKGGKRIRGSLAMEAYALFEGDNQPMITQAACALEMLNTYILIADDIQDRSESRRGGKTAHIQMRDFHVKKHLKGDSLHFGEAMAINSFLIAQHYAANLIATLPTSADIRIKALQNVNKCFIVTAHGQTMDIFVESNGAASSEEVNHILEWKTAYYTFINPLQLGGILAGARKADMAKLADYGLHAGRAFQLVDDIIGTFGSSDMTGKSPLDDIKEGKRTLMVLAALEKANASDSYFLEACLGSQQLTMHDFEKCQSIITKTGALDYTKEQAEQSSKKAIAAISSETTWVPQAKQFLIDLAQYILVRNT